MKKLALACAFIGFIAFAATAQTQTAGTKTETSAKSDSHSGKACCSKKDKKACKEGEGKSCCKGKSKKECNHDETGMKGEEKTSSEKETSKAGTTK